MNRNRQLARIQRWWEHIAASRRLQLRGGRKDRTTGTAGTARLAWPSLSLQLRAVD